MNKFTCTGCGISRDVENSSGEDLTVENCPACKMSYAGWKTELTETVENIVSNELKHAELLLKGRDIFKSMQGGEALLFALEKTMWMRDERRKINEKIDRAI